MDTMIALRATGTSGSFHRAVSLQSFQKYREVEEALQSRSTTLEGSLLEYETLELRVSPPNINIDNDTCEDSTIITIDSANRPGTLIEVVQHFTELGFNVRSARISSDGGWFVDEFRVTDQDGQKVKDERKLDSIRHMLDISPAMMEADEPVTTVFELAGEDRAGLLAEITSLLNHNGCETRSAAVWTYRQRVAFVIGVQDGGKPISDGFKLQRLVQIMKEIMSARTGAPPIVRVENVKGKNHHERRLHQLMLHEENHRWLSMREEERQTLINGSDLAAVGVSTQPQLQLQLHAPLSACGAPHDDMMSEAPPPTGPEDVAPVDVRPDIEITYSPVQQYWIVLIRSRDRPKLLFDTVCTLADLKYDVYHGTIDSEGSNAVQEYYLRPRVGDWGYDKAQAAHLKYHLECAIQRRFPNGLKVLVHSRDRRGILSLLAHQLSAQQISITRAKVMLDTMDHVVAHTLYVMHADGRAPDRKRIEDLCRGIGGRLMAQNPTDLEVLSMTPPGSTGLDDGRAFSFAFLRRNKQTVHGSPPVNIGGSQGDSMQQSY